LTTPPKSMSNDLEAATPAPVMNFASCQAEDDPVTTALSRTRGRRKTAAKMQLQDSS
jgi:hypothetical protein